jgi:hypothetical protein
MFKLLVAVNLRGFVMFADGPFQGADYDDTLWSKVPPAKKSDVVLLGDGHFSASCELAMERARNGKDDRVEGNA